MNNIHGGDIYRNHVDIDFSININPLGVPDAVISALHGAVSSCSQYPDLAAHNLKLAVSKMLDVPEEYLLFGNGASELFMAIVHGILPKKTVIAVPSFYGYEYAAKACEGSISYYVLKEKNNFSLDEGILKVLNEDMNMLFLANPNNPVGGLVPKELMHRLLEHCQKRGIYVVMDECFLDFCGQVESFLPRYVEYPNVIWIRAFTKIFAIPGVRLGFLVNSEEALLEKIAGQLPEWNLSTFAQKAGLACSAEKEYIKQTRCYVEREGQFLSEGLKKAGLKVYPHAADFILVHTEVPLYDRLLERGILIRDCSSFHGLSKGYYRIAVKRREENEQLLEEIGEIL